MTVLGSITPDELGITLPHEHLLVDVSAWLLEPLLETKKCLADVPVCMDILGELRRDFAINKDNMRLNNTDLAVEELGFYREKGGKSLVDLTCTGLGGNTLDLCKISERTGVNVILGAGFYLESTHPAYVKRKSVDDLAFMIVKKLTEGVDDTRVRAGVIGEIGCSDPLTKNEMKVLEAAGRAQSQTNAALTIHVGLWNPKTKEREQIKKAREYLDLVIKGGGNPRKIYLSHMDVTCLDTKYHQSLIDGYGVTLDYDHFGMEYYCDSRYPGAYGMSDRVRQEALLKLLRAGYEKHLMLSDDICTKTQLKKYGGYGYAHILSHILPALKYAGVTDKQIRAMTIDNPKRILSF